MSFVVRLAQKLLGQSTRSATLPKNLNTPNTPSTFRDFTRFVAGDRVLINGKRLSNPLHPGASSSVPQSNGQLRHDDVLGQPLGTVRINGTDGRYIKVEQPTLDQYVSLTRRNVTPIYAAYASTIVFLLDIHPHTPGPPTSQPQQNRLEILEAGTGHGSLTIHLARAIAAANQPPPLSALPQGRQTDAADATINAEWSEWFKSRRAVLHTVEKVPKNSHDAETLIKEFRQGLYWPHIDFHTGGVDSWLQDRLHAKPAGFLSYIILDLPGLEQVLPLATKAMREDAVVCIFCPSVTQIAECQKSIKQQRLPLVHVKAVELGEGISTGRVWDVRAVVPRKALAEAADIAGAARAGSETLLESALESEGDAESPAAAEEEEISGAHAEQVKFVCRPKVGERTFGGGFLGLWRKSTYS